ncbi:MAG: hypothetical protein HYY50_01530 [Candidatus Kerfeldbacteria bacterium]|nr:hypothetical protein [Candidatus Kerfeldbacteria bacterium]
MKVPASLTSFLVDHFRWAAGTVMAIIFILGYLLLLQGRIDTLRTAGFLERRKVEAELNAQRQFARDLRTSVDRFRQALTPDRLEVVDHFIPTGPDFPGLLLTLDNIARSANLRLDSMIVSQAGQTGNLGDEATASGEGAVSAATISGVNLRTQDVSVLVSGGASYDHFKRFISLVESSQRLLDVITLNFVTPQKDESEASESYGIVVRTYYLPDEQA